LENIWPLSTGILTEKDLLKMADPKNK